MLIEIEQSAHTCRVYLAGAGVRPPEGALFTGLRDLKSLQLVAVAAGWREGGEVWFAGGTHAPGEVFYRRVLLRSIADMLFKALGAERVFAEVAEDNESSRRWVLSYGFRPTNGGRLGFCLFVLEKSNCRWLNGTE